MKARFTHHLILKHELKYIYIHIIPEALADGFIDLNELRSHANASSVAKLFQTDASGAIVTNSQGFGIPTAEGQILITNAQQYL